MAEVRGKLVFARLPGGLHRLLEVAAAGVGGFVEHHVERRQAVAERRRQLAEVLAIRGRIGRAHRDEHGDARLAELLEPTSR